MKRDVVMTQAPVVAQEGAGVKLNRVFPVGRVDDIDPFLLLDHFGSDEADDYIAGFPMHPHRGIETVTYMLEGKIRHRDSVGNEGMISSGGVQWMSAGRGIMHEEMPEQTNGLLEGFQLWVNLPASEKMKQPEYQEFKAEEITQFEHQGHQLRLISGELLGHAGVVRHISTLPLYADIHLTQGRLVLDLPVQHNAFIYVFQGETSVINEQGEKRTIAAPQLASLSAGDALVLETDNSARLMLAAACKIEEPIVRWGPFVMNTREEIQQTLNELKSGQFPPH